MAAAKGIDGSGAGGTDAGVGSPTVAENPTDASKNRIEMDASPSACHGLGPLRVADKCTPAKTVSSFAEVDAGAEIDDEIQRRQDEQGIELDPAVNVEGPGCRVQLALGSEL